MPRMQGDNDTTFDNDADDIMSRIDRSIASTEGGDIGGGDDDRQDTNTQEQTPSRRQQRTRQSNDGDAQDDASSAGDNDGTRRTTRQPNTQQQQQQQQQTRQTQTRQQQQQRVTPNQQQQQQQQQRNAGDLVDGQGQVVATAGRERRYYESWQRTNHALTQANERVTALQGEIDTYRSANSMAQQLGITPVEQAAAYQFAAAWKRDPKRAITALLTNARQQGIELDLEGVSPAVDIDAVTNRIMQRLQPVVDTAAAHQEQQDARAEAQRTYNAFLSNYPDAALHQEPIANLLSRRPGMSLVEAYQNIKLFALESGLDWNQPLKPQLDALADQQQQQQANGGTQRVTPRPLTGGGRTGGRMNGGQAQQPQKPKMYAANTSWDTIAREIIDEFAGNNQ